MRYMMYAQTSTQTYHCPFNTLPRISLRIKILYTTSWNNVTGQARQIHRWCSDFRIGRKKERKARGNLLRFFFESPTCMIGNNTTLSATCDTDICDANPLAGRHERVPVQVIGVVAPASEAAEALLFGTAAEEKANVNKLNFCSQTSWTRFSAKTSPGFCTPTAFCLTTIQRRCC
jgi:hypothetical protein